MPEKLALSADQFAGSGSVLVYVRIWPGAALDSAGQSVQLKVAGESGAALPPAFEIASVQLTGAGQIALITLTPAGGAK